MEVVVQVMYCAEARTTFAADLKRVAEDGVKMATKALQVHLLFAPFKF